MVEELKMLSTLLVKRIELVLAYCLVLDSKEVTCPGLVAGEG